MQNCTKFSHFILRKIIENCCHQMLYFEVKMHQIRFRLGLRPSPRWGSLQRSPDPQLEFRGPTSKGRRGKEKRKEEKVGGKEGKGKERGWRGRGRREGAPPSQ